MLTGKQVVLRPVERDDLKLFHKWKNDEGIMRLGNSYPDSSQSMVMLETEYEKVLKGEDISRRDYIIEEKTSKRPVGWGRTADLHPSKAHDKRQPRTCTWRKGRLEERIRVRDRPALAGTSL